MLLCVLEALFTGVTDVGVAGAFAARPVHPKRLEALAVGPDAARPCDCRCTDSVSDEVPACSRAS